MANRTSKLDTLYTEWSSAQNRFGYELDLLLLGVLRHARRVCRDEEAAADVDFVVSRKLHEFSPVTPDAFSRWVGAICRRVRIDHLRRRTREWKRNVPFDEQQHTISSTDDDYSDIDTAQLQPWQREVMAHLQNGRTLKETAALMRTTPNALRNRLYRARP